MANKDRAPNEILQAISRHFDDRSEGREPPDHPAREKEKRISRAGTRGQRDAELLWYPPTAENSGSFACRFCRPGWNRYVADVYAPRPTALALTDIRGHFARQHGIKYVPRGSIRYKGNEREEQLATWLPMTPETEAGIVCSLCPDGMNRIFFGSHACGDSRRHRALLRGNQELWNELEGFEPEEQAILIEAWDRKLVRDWDLPKAKRELAALNRELRPREPSPLELAYRDLLLELVAEGQTKSDAVDELQDLQTRDPIAFRCRLAERLPEVAAYGEQEGVTPKQVAAYVVELYGPPERSRKMLFNYYNAAPAKEREAAEEASRQARERGR